MILGLTGGMGCGKSTASGFFAEAGFRLIDCDAIVRDEVLVDPAIVARIVSRFGPEVAPGGSIARPALAAKVFGDPAALRDLEAIVHPEVSARWRSRVASAPDDFWVVEIPLLYEKDLQKVVDFVVCVACAEPLQLARLEKRGVPRDLAAQRIAQQLPLSRKVHLADFVLTNDGTSAFLKAQVLQLASHLKAASYKST